MGWQIALAVAAAITGVAVLVIYLPVGIRATYDQRGLKTRYTVFSIPIMSFDLMDDEEKSISLNKILTSTGKVKKQPQPEAIQKAPRTADKLSQFWEDMKLLLRFYWGLLDIVVLKRLELKLVLAGDDPMDLAMHYGETCAAVGGLIAVVENILTIASRNISVECDFTAENTTLTARLDFVVPLGKVIGYVLKFLIDLVKKSAN